MMAGRTACRSPITAYVARVTIGASRSVLMARIALADEQPTMCWIAPLMPQAMYRSGAIRVPVWPTCWACGRQPAEVTTRDTPDRATEQRGELVELGETLGAADAATAADDDPRVGERDLAASGGDVRGDPDPEVAIGQVRGERLDGGRCAGREAAAGANACGATVSSRIGPSSRASSSRLPPQRWRVTCHGSPGRTSVTLAASGNAEAGGGVGQDLRAALAAGADHGGRGVAFDQLGQAFPRASGA